MKVSVIATHPPTTTERLKRKKSGPLTMATDRPPKAPQNPTTAVLPRVRAAQRTPNASTSLHPNVTTRSPKSLARKARAGSVASPDGPYNKLAPRPYVARPSSAASNRSFAPSNQGGTPSRRSRGATNGSPMFFHASEVSSPSTPSSLVSTYSAAPHAPWAGPKFFHADGAPSAMDDGDSGDQHCMGERTPQGSSAGSQIGPNVPMLAPSQSTRTPSHSLPSSRPTSVVGFPASPRPTSAAVGSSRTIAPTTTPLGNRNHVKFVYANGTEELLPPRDPTEIGSATASPQLPSSPFSGASNSPSPTKAAYLLSPLVSPSGPSSPPSYFQRHAGPGSSRRSSVDMKTRHSRGLSISSVVELPIPIPTNEETGDADDEARHGTGESGSSSEEAEDEEAEEAPPPLMTAAERIKLMEERSAASRRERKVMDLEISNASLLAINKTLERELRKQAAELRRYKRLARSGRLSTAPSAADRSTSAVPATTIDAASDWEVDEAEDDEDTETENLSEEEEEDDDESSANDEKHRAADEKRLTIDLSKHQALLDASTKMNKSLRCSLLVTDQLIKEGKKALEYKVRPSDIRLGGRILCDEEDYYESPMESIGVSAAEETDAELYTESELETETEAETEMDDESEFHNSYIPPEELQPVRHSLV